MKRIISLIVLLVMLFSLCSCIRGDYKYDYDLTKYISLPDYQSFSVEVRDAAIQAAIDNYIMKASSEYKVKEGDDVYVDIKFYEVDISTDPSTGKEYDTEGDEITELRLTNFLLRDVGSGTICRLIEGIIEGNPISSKPIGNKLTLPEDFFNPDYIGTSAYVYVTITNKVVEAGDVVLVEYEGIHLDENGEIKIENGKEDVFDSSSSAKFYIGSHMAIDDFENGMIGHTIGNEFEIEATFPEDYGNEEFNGKDVIFRVTIKSIHKAPIYNSTFTESYFGYETTDAFREYLIDEYVLTEIYDYLAENSEVLKIPKYEYKNTLKDLQNIEDSFYEENGVTLEAYIESMYDMTIEEYVTSQVTSELIIYGIAEQQGFVPTDAQMETERTRLIEYYTEYYGKSLDGETAAMYAVSYVDGLGKMKFYENVLYAMVDQYLLETVQITTVEKDYQSITEIIAEQNAPVTE